MVKLPRIIGFFVRVVVYVLLLDAAILAFLHGTTNLAAFRYVGF